MRWTIGVSIGVMCTTDKVIVAVDRKAVVDIKSVTPITPHTPRPTQITRATATTSFLFISFPILASWNCGSAPDLSGAEFRGEITNNYILKIMPLLADPGKLSKRACDMKIIASFSSSPN
jgi:hypothetical protein